MTIKPTLYGWVKSIINALYASGIMIAIVGVISFPVLIIVGGNYWISPLIIFSGAIPVFIGIGIAVIAIVL